LIIDTILLLKKAEQYIYGKTAKNTVCHIRVFEPYQYTSIDTLLFMFRKDHSPVKKY